MHGQVMALLFISLLKIKRSRQTLHAVLAKHQQRIEERESGQVMFYGVSFNKRNKKPWLVVKSTRFIDSIWKMEEV